MDWIKVSERLPIIEEEVLIFDRRGDIYLACLYTDDDDEYEFISNGYVKDDISHWMFLPEAPHE